MRVEVGGLVAHRFHALDLREHLVVDVALLGVLGHRGVVRKEIALLVAQAFIPPTERTEVAGFAFPGDDEAIRAEVIRRLNTVASYRQLFGAVYPSVRVGGPITYDMFARAIAEFEFTLTFANAPIDRYARGQLDAMTKAEKRGALVFFGKGRCSTCHAVSGSSNEMFT